MISTPHLRKQRLIRGKLQIILGISIISQQTHLKETHANWLRMLCYSQKNRNNLTDFSCWMLAFTLPEWPVFAENYQKFIKNN